MAPWLGIFTHAPLAQYEGTTRIVGDGHEEAAFGRECIKGGNAGLTLKGGSVVRIVDRLPGKASPIHRSFSIDYGIVIAGERELELDGGEIVRLKAGDIVVQRGTVGLPR